MVHNIYNIYVHYNSNAIAYFICSRNNATVGSMNPASRRLSSGVVEQPGVGLWNPHFFVLNFKRCAKQGLN